MHSSLVVYIVLFIECARAAFDASVDVEFRLYRRENPTDFSIIDIFDARYIFTDQFDPRLPTRIYIHGFYPNRATLDRYPKVYSNLGDYNFIMVDWTEGADDIVYYWAKDRVEEVGERVADLIDALVANGMNMKNLIMVGHSLGAHVAGCAAKNLRSDQKIGSIIGLDPAGIGYDLTETYNRLTEEDAEYVQVIHTDISKFGMAEPIGHADFYINGGIEQPGCKKRNMMTKWFDVCSHHRAHMLFWKTLTINFTAIKCESYEEIMDNECTFQNVTTIMGGDTIPNTSKAYGSFYIETTKRSPYVIPDYRSFKNIYIYYQ